MPLVVPTTGDLLIVNYMVTVFASNLTMRLFKNNYIPVQDTVAVDFVEADFDGYTAQAITGWGAPVLDGVRAVSAATNLTWTKSAGTATNNIYGYYVTTPFGQCIWAERDPNAPIEMTNTGDLYIVTPRISGRSEF